MPETNKYIPYIEIIDGRNRLLRPDTNFLTLTKDIQRPCYRIIGGKLQPNKKKYKIKLLNKIDLKIDDILTLVLKLPTEIGNYEIQSSSNSTPIKNISSWLSFESEEGCFSIEADSSSTVTHACGWITFNLIFIVQDVDMHKICKMKYSLCFDPTDLINKNVSCITNEHNTIIKYESNSCLYINTLNS